MKIAFECRDMNLSTSGGIAQFWQGILRHLIHHHPEHEYFIFYCNQNLPLLKISSPNVHYYNLGYENFFEQVGRLCHDVNINVLIRSFPNDGEDFFPLIRQIVEIPDLQHEYLPEFFTADVLKLRREIFNYCCENLSIITLSTASKNSILERTKAAAQNIYIVSPSLLEEHNDKEIHLTDAEKLLIPTKKYFFYPANLWPHKNHPSLLQGFRKFLQNAQADFELILTGNISGWDDLQKDFHDVPVRHLGFVSKQLVALLLKNAEALTFFSLFEGFGMPLLEAFAAETPVICSNVTSLPEVGQDAVLMCNPLDVDAIANAMLRITTEIDLRKTLIGNGKKRLEYYTWDKSVQDLLSACNSVNKNAELQSNYNHQEKTIMNKQNDIEITSDCLADLNTKLDELHKKLNAQSDAMRDMKMKLNHIQYRLDQASLFRRIKTFLKPKLNLEQHPPAPLLLPKPYYQPIELGAFPKISITTPSYKQGEFIERTIKSVLEQHYPNLEYVVQDGGSKDNTIAVLEKHANELFYWESAKDQGQTNAINLGFARTSGDIMAYLNSDDMLLHGALHYVAKYFAENPTVDVIYGHRILIDKNDKEVGRWILPKHANKVMQWVDYVPQETMFWRRSIWEKIGGKLDETFQFAMDWDLVLRFQEAGAKIVRVPRFLAAFRVHEEQKSSSVLMEAGYAEMERLRVRCHHRPVAIREIRSNIRSYLMRHVILQKLYRLGLLKL